MNPKLQFTYRKLESLNPYANNPRAHSTRQIRKIAKSIATFGVINPLVVDSEGTIVAGHGRYEAARLLGLQEVPVVAVEHLTPAQIMAYRVADNKLAEEATWDADLLRVEIEYLVSVDFDIDLTGYDLPEIDVIVGNTDTSCMATPKIPPVPGDSDTTSRQGDLWITANHRIMCGDCRSIHDIDTLMNGQTAAAVFTDPPYNVPIKGHVSGNGKVVHEDFEMASGEMSTADFIAFLVRVLIELARASKPGAVHFICMDWRHVQELMAAGRDVYDALLNLCVWVKTNGGMGSFYRSRHELVLVYRVHGANHINNIELGRFGRNRTNVWEYAGINAFGKERDALLAMHPTVKPLQMVADAILDVTHPGDVVLDGFLGSGTTLLAAAQTGRIGYGIEIDPRYVDVALRRWMDLTGEQPIHAVSGLTFDELEAVRHAHDTAEV